MSREIQPKLNFPEAVSRFLPFPLSSLIQLEHSNNKTFPQNYYKTAPANAKYIEFALFSLSLSLFQLLRIKLLDDQSVSRTTSLLPFSTVRMSPAEKISIEIEI
jgi:hypothetical protein